MGQRHQMPGKARFYPAKGATSATTLCLQEANALFEPLQPTEALDKAALPGILLLMTEQAACIVRRMSTAELPTVIDVWYRSLYQSLTQFGSRQRPSEEGAHQFFRNVVAQRCDLWVAEHLETIVGMLALAGNEIERLYVAPEARGQGMGSALLEQAKAMYPAGLWLVTLQSNSGARRFYERHGFVAYELGMSAPPESEPDASYRWSPSTSV
jgi:ribosomal protein S18 acetylase RimI-like enzyme